MITNKLLSVLGFSDIDGYFIYVMDAINGNPAEARRRYRALSKIQRRQFMLWLHGLGGDLYPVPAILSAIDIVNGTKYEILNNKN